ncbi:hypothetical protein SETIT_9G565700v2 [Setaria italica]|uniref:DUF4378 domain-containing protein n=1 Tax=Setaria italica TaxID=4555 RepID=K4A995_SETIT|nr:uncharacterized protein LOC101759329 [Setaria italica]RCV46869.1 hypothetical protein SETIT_9G565700v2 [Setaria italica]
MAAAARGPPVTLRDFLELGCDSSSDGFRSYPRCLPWSDEALQVPVRLLVEADHLRRSPSRSPSSLFSLAKSPGPGALARISSLSRSFSRRIKEGFWRRREDEEEDDLYFDDRDSCGFPSPQVSSCSASDSESEYAEADDVAIDEKMACPATSQPAFQCSSSAEHDCTDAGAPGAAGDGKKMQAVAADGDSAVGRGKLGMEDKQQLSPVSVLDFPFDDDDGDERSDAGTCSPSFHRCPPPPDLLHSRTMTKQAQLLHKIRRYDGIAQAVDPVDLEARFTTTSESGESVDASTHPATTSSCTDTTSSATTTKTASRHGEEHQSVEQPSQEPEEPDEYRLLARLLLEDTVAVVDEVSQVLLLEFFTEGLDRLRCSSAAGSVVGAIISPRVDDERDKVAAEALVRAAAEWLRGAGAQWGIRDVMLSGKAALEDMERGRRWMCVGEEEREVGAAVEGFVMDELVDELVEELAPCWHGDGRRRSSR